jgi:CBS domain containing-hemolysin-like protein
MELLTFSWQIAVILLLVAANGFFVAAEFAIVKVRSSQLKPLLRDGNWQVRLAWKVTRQLDAYLSATQLGITLSSLGLGWLGEPFIARWIEIPVSQMGFGPAVVHTTAYIIAFSLITFLHIVLGELAPKSVAIQRPKFITLWLSAPLIAFYYVFFPAIWFLNGTANRMLRWAGVPPASEGEHAYTDEELQHLFMHASHAHPSDELINKLMIKALRLKETTAEQVMLPQDQVCVLWKDHPLQVNLRTAQKAGYSRIPLCGESVNDVLGVIHVKELLWQHLALGEQTRLEDIVHPILTFTPTTRLPAMLEFFRRSRTHLAMVLDDSGRNMRGIVSFEDVLEELVGDIRDEFDIEKGPIFQRTDHSVLVDADMPVRDLANEMVQWPLPMKTTESVQEWCLHHFGNLPKKGASVVVEGNLEVVAEEVRAHRIRRVRITRVEAPAAGLIT